MAQIFGEIGAFKELRRVLISAGIREMRTLDDLTGFLSSYNYNKINAPGIAEEKVLNHIRNLESRLEQYRKDYKTTKEVEAVVLEDKTKSLDQRILKIQSRITHSRFGLFSKIVLLRVLTIRKKSLVKKNRRFFQSKLKEIEAKGKRVSKELENSIKNKSDFIKKESDTILGRLEYIHKTIQTNNLLFTGSIGENLVEAELKKLPDDYIVFNDYKITFHPPIFSKKYTKGIFSVQIDHLVISKSGIYIIETKNWSKKSVESLDLRSPVGQMERAGYALYIKLRDAAKNNNLLLNKHHWGNKRIPIKNLLVLINNKPKEEFEHVKVLTLGRLNGYIGYFSQIFDDQEIKHISDYLDRLRDR